MNHFLAIGCHVLESFIPFSFYLVQGEIDCIIMLCELRISVLGAKDLKFYQNDCFWPIRKDVVSLMVVCGLVWYA